MPIFPRYRSSTSSRVGILSPANSAPNQLPASSRFSSFRVRSPTRPVPSVVRSTVASWMTTRWPSLLICTSNSKKSAFIFTALSKAARVFSGAWPEVPRWAMFKNESLASAPGPPTPKALHTNNVSKETSSQNLPRNIGSPPSR